MAGAVASFRILSGVFIALFCFASLVQWNDPDPVRWAALYAAAAAVTAAVVWGRASPALPAALGLVASLWCVSLAPAAAQTSFPELFRSWKMMSPGMEFGREALGLVIVAGWMLALYRRARARVG